MVGKEKIFSLGENSLIAVVTEGQHNFPAVAEDCVPAYCIRSFAAASLMRRFFMVGALALAHPLPDKAGLACRTAFHAAFNDRLA